jgi:hypothetical protein
VVGQLGQPAALEAPELLLGNYYRGVLTRGRVVQQVECGTAGASDVTPFELI